MFLDSSSFQYHFNNHFNKGEAATRSSKAKSMREEKKKCKAVGSVLLTEALLTGSDIIYTG